MKKIILGVACAAALFAAGADAAPSPHEAVRRQLIAKYSTGTIVLSGLIRLAFSTTPSAKLPALFANVAAAVRDVRGLA